MATRIRKILDQAPVFINLSVTILDEDFEEEDYRKIVSHFSEIETLTSKYYKEKKNK